MERPNIKPLSKKYYVASAQNVMKYLADMRFEVNRSTLTSSKLRNLLAMSSSIYDITRNQGVDAALDKLLQFKIQMIYQAGREASVKEFLEASKLPAYVDKILTTEDKDKQKTYTLRMCHYMEALIAYFKYYGGRD